MASHIVDILRQRFEHSAESVAYRFELQGVDASAAELRYGQLYLSASKLAEKMHQLGLSGKTVLLSAEPDPDFVIALYASMICGAVAVPAYAPSKHRMYALSKIVDSARPAAVLGSSRIFAKFRRRLDSFPALKDSQWVEVGVAAADKGAWVSSGAWWDGGPAIDQNGLAFLQYTSGSTSQPRGVEIRHRNLIANLARQREALKHPPGEAIVSWLPLHHDMGLVGQLLWGLFVASPVVLLSPLEVFQRPLRWLQAIDRYRAHTSGGPNFVYDACVDAISPDELQNLDLSHWKAAFNGAEPVRASTLERFSTHFAAAGFSYSSWIPSYGLAETCVFATAAAKEQAPTILEASASALSRGYFAAPSSPEERSIPLVSVGAPQLGDEIAVVEMDASGTRTMLADGRIGEIWLRGPSVCDGYYGVDKKDTPSFVYDEGQEVQWLRTGDLGFRHDGELFVTGRVKDLIIAQGSNIYPHDLESMLSEMPELVAGGCIAFGVEDKGSQRPWMAVELRRSMVGEVEKHGDVIVAIRRLLSARCGVDLGGVLLLRPGGIPRTTSGKVQRQRCKMMWQGGELNPLREQRFVPDSHLEEPEVIATKRQEFAALVGPEERGAWLVAEVQAWVSSRVPGTCDLSAAAVELGLASIECSLLGHWLSEITSQRVDMVDLLGAPDLRQWVLQRAAHADDLDSEDRDPAAIPSLDRANELSYSQLAVWTVHQKEGQSAHYNVHLVLELEEKHEPSSIQAAFEELRRRHSVLRTRYVVNGEGGVQARVDALSERALDFEVVLQTRDDDSIAQRVQRIVHQPFDLAKQHPQRVRLLVDPAGRQTLVWVMHHIAVDFWSLVVLVSQLQAWFRGERDEGWSPGLEYQEYAQQQRWCVQQFGERDWAYWRRQLGGQLPERAFCLDTPAPEGAFDLSADLAQEQRSLAGSTHRIRLSSAAVEAIDRVAKQHRTTRYGVCLALFAALLQQRGKERELMIGTPVSGREDARWHDVVGYFVNPVALRIPVAAHDTLKSLIERVTKVVHEALTHRHLPFSTVVERIAPRRSAMGWPLYHVAFTYQSSQRPEQESLAALALGEESVQASWGELKVRHAKLRDRVENFDLKLVAAPLGAEIVAAFQYNSRVLKAETIEAMAREYKALAECLVGQDGLDCAIGDVLAGSQAGLLMQPEPQSGPRPGLPSESRPGPRPGSRPGSRSDEPDNLYQEEDVAQEHLLTRWESWVEVRPQMPLMEEGDAVWTVEDLDRWSDAIAREIQAQKVVAGSAVALCMGMSPAFLAAALACIKCGLSYVPIEKAYPEKRKAWMLSDAQAKLVLVDEPMEEPIKERGDVPVPGTPCLVVGELGSETASRLAQKQRPRHSAEIIYVIYTSGSTGQPKGVEVSHRALMKLLRWHQREYLPQEGMRVTLTASVGFDASAWELWSAVFSGATIVLCPDDTRQDPDQLLPWLAQQRIGGLFLATAMAREVLGRSWPESSGQAPLILTGGDALGDISSLLQSWPGKVMNHYGVTEAAVVATAGEVRPELGGPAPIGRALPGILLRLLNERGHPVADGAVGEMYLSGAMVAQGYLGQARATAAAFVPDPWGNPGQRMYATGDLARWQDGGQGTRSLAYVGRKDDQVQIRGRRVEPGEIRAALESMDGVKQAYVDVQTHPAQRAMLVGYLIRSGDFAHRVEREKHALGQVQDWQHLYDQVYGALPIAGGEARDDADLVGWESSGTAGVLPSEQMWSWVDETVEDILDLSPRAVLEVGSGSGLIAKAVAPHCSYYLATDLSERAAKHLQVWAQNNAIEHLDAHNCAAHQLASLLDNHERRAEIDTVVLNSVVQYFPSLDYLAQCLERLWELPGLRCIYIGDIRDAHLSHCMHLELAVQDCAEAQSLQKIWTNAQDSLALERELCVSAPWWWAFCAKYPDIELRASLKRGDYDNELSRFRYNVVLERRCDRISPRSLRFPESIDLVDAHNWSDPQQNLRELASSIVASSNRGFFVRGLRDARIWGSLTRLHRWSELGVEGREARKLAEDDQGSSHALICPSIVRELGQDRGLRAEAWVSPQRNLGKWDLLLVPKSVQVQRRSLRAFCSADAEPTAVERSAELANDPLEQRVEAEFLQEIRSQLEARLPAFMVPEHLVVMAGFPITAHGKVDRQALPKVQLRSQGRRQPQGPKARLLAKIWGAVLGVQRVHEEDNFFELGGDSILAIQVATRAREEGLKLAARDLFAHQSLADLAGHAQWGTLDECDGAGDEEAVVSTPWVPLSAMQRGIWLEQDASERYIEQVVLELQGTLDPEVLERSWRWALARHDALRCVVEWSREGGRQRPVAEHELYFDWTHRSLATSAPAVEELDLEVLAQQRAKIQEQCERDRRGFARGQAPLMRWTLLEVEPGSWRLIWTHAHVLLDGWSVPLVLRDVFFAYRSMFEGRDLDPRPAPSYIRMVPRLDRSPDTAQDYWKERIGEIQRAQQPLGQSGGLSTAFDLAMTLARGRVKSLRQNLQFNRCTLSHFIFAAWALVWGHARGQSATVVGIVDSGRDRELPGIADTVGLLIRSLPLVLPLSDPHTLQSFVATVGQRVQELMCKGVASLSDIAQWVGHERGDELFTTLVAVENYPRDALLGHRFGGISLQGVQHHGCTHYPLTVVVTGQDELTIRFQGNGQQVSREEAEICLQNFEMVLDAWIQDAFIDIAALRAKLFGIVTAGQAAVTGQSVHEGEARLGTSPDKGGKRAEHSLDSMALQNPEPALVERLVEAWCEVFERDDIRVDDDFFHLGGDSIVAMTLVERLRRGGDDCTVQSVMTLRTIEALARDLQQNRALGAETAASKYDATNYVPSSSNGALLPIQRWLFAQSLENPHHFNQSFLYRLQSVRDPEILQAALNELSAHHPALRSNFKGMERKSDEPLPLDQQASLWRSVECEDTSRRWTFEVVPGHSTPRFEAIAAGLQAGFNLSQGPLFAAIYCESLDDMGPVLFLCAHHLVVDAVSWRILLSDLEQAYLALQNKQPVVLPASTASMAQWAEALSGYAQGIARDQLKYWRSLPWCEVRGLAIELATDLATELATDPGRGGDRVGDRRYHRAWLDEETTQDLLTAAPRIFHTQVTEVLLCGWLRAMASHFGAQTMSIDLEGHGREDAVLGLNTERSVGWFTTQFPFVCDLSIHVETPLEGVELRERLNDVKRRLRAIPDRGLGWSALYWMGSPELRHELRQLPASEICFNYLGRVDADLAGASSMLGGESKNDHRFGTDHDLRNTNAYAIDVNLCTVGPRLHIHLAHSSGLDDEKMQALLHNFVTSLSQIAAASREALAPEAKDVSDFGLVADQVDHADFAAILEQLDE